MSADATTETIPKLLYKELPSKGLTLSEAQSIVRQQVEEDPLLNLVFLSLVKKLHKERKQVKSLKKQLELASLSAEQFKQLVTQPTNKVEE